MIDIGCEYPENDVVIKRKTLWATWGIMLAIPFQQRDIDWYDVVSEIKRLLNASREQSSWTMRLEH